MKTKNKAEKRNEKYFKIVNTNSDKRNRVSKKKEREMMKKGQGKKCLIKNSLGSPCDIFLLVFDFDE